MTNQPASATEMSDLPFKYVGGDPSVDLVNTVDWTSRGPLRERLTSYERLTQWAEEAGVVPPAVARRLRRLARTRPQAAAAACRRAQRLRAVLQRLYGSLAAGERSPGAWSDLNAELAAALGRLRLSPQHAAPNASSAASWEWREAGEHFDALLWPVVWSAARLLTSDEAGRLRVCAGPDCGWMYVDRSRNGLRRWCEMQTCGTAEKSRRRRGR